MLDFNLDLRVIICTLDYHWWISTWPYHTLHFNMSDDSLNDLDIPSTSTMKGRYQPGVTGLNGHIYVVGGCESWSCLNSVEKYNPNTNNWEMVSSMHTARRGCGVAVFNGKLYVVGGHDGIHSLCSVEIYDPETNVWSPGPSLTSCRANVVVCVVGNLLFAVGGFNGRTFLNTVEFLDSRSNEWTTFVSKELSNNMSEVSIKEKNQNGSLEYNTRQTNGYFPPNSEEIM